MIITSGEVPGKLSHSHEDNSPPGAASTTPHALVPESVVLECGPVGLFCKDLAQHNVCDSRAH